MSGSSAVATRGRGRHSPLYVWLRKNHDAFAAALEENGPAWAQLAANMGKHGITNGDAKQPTPEGVRMVWYRVRRDVEAAHKASPPRPARVRLPPVDQDVTAHPRAAVPDPTPIPLAAAGTPGSVAPGPANTPGGDALARIRREADIRSGRKPNAS